MVRPAQDRFSCFALLWSLVVYIELISSRDWFLNPSGLVYVLAMFWVWTNPRSVRVFFCFLLAAVAHQWGAMPMVANHIVFEFWANCAMLAAIAVAFFRPAAGIPLTAQAYANISSIVRVLAILMYFFAVLAKFNFDFWDPRVSCASRYFPGAWQWAPAIAVFFEVLILIGLMRPATRDPAILTAALFHFFLGVFMGPRVFGFSMMMFALLFLFMSEGAALRTVALARSVRVWRQLNLPDVPFLFLRNVILFGCAVAPLVRMLYFPSVPKMDVLVWWLLSAAVIGAYTLGILSSRNIFMSHHPRPNGLSFWLIVVLALPMILNGVSPYLGFKTQGSFTMFSNLRTQGARPNHMFIPSWLQLHKESLIRIIGSDRGQFLRKVGSPYAVVEFEFRRQLAQAKGDFFVIFEAGNMRTKVRKTKGTIDDPSLAPAPYWQTKFMRFRPVDLRDTSQCLW